MKLSLLIFTLILSSIIISTPEGSDVHTTEIRTIEVGIDENAAPIEFIENGKPAGFNIDLINLIASRIHYQVNFHFMDWVEVLAAVENGSLDLMFATITPERQEVYDFSTPYLNITWKIFVQQEIVGIATLEDLENRTVAVVRDFASENYIKENFPLIHIVSVDSTEEGMRLLNQKDVFAFFGQEHMALYYIQENNYVNIKTIGESIAYRQMAIAVQKGNAELLEEINSGFQIILSNGDYNNLYAQWYGGVIDFSILTIPDWLIVLLLALVITISILIPAILVLNKMNQQKAEKLRDNQQALDQQQRMTSIGLLAAGIAHDFNNILTSILGNVNMVQLEDISDEAKEFLNAAEQGIETAKGITNQLLTFSKGGNPIKKVSSIIPVLKASIDLTIRGSNCDYELEINDTLPSVEIDAGQLKQVFNNILINAIQSMPQGGKINIRLRLTNQRKEPRCAIRGEVLAIEIEDHGIGISKQNQEKIFMPYFTRKQDGNGLGLATSYSIIQRHNGGMAFKSELGVGTTFYIYLPTTSKQAEVEKNHEIIQKQYGGNILVMDDLHEVKDLLAKMLKHMGFQVDVVPDGEAAIEIIKNDPQKYDLLFLDLIIPGRMGGKETLKKMLKINPDLKAIVISGYSNDDILSKPKEYGFIGALKKPFSLKDLKKLLQNIG